MNLDFLLSFGFHIQAIVGSVVIWIFSWLWHDHIIVKPWLRWTGMTLEEASALHKGRLQLDLGLYLVSKIIFSYSCLAILALISPATAIGYFVLGTVISIGLVFTSGVGPVIFENRSSGLWVLSSTLTTLSIYMLLASQFFSVHVFCLY